MDAVNKLARLEKVLLSLLGSFCVAFLLLTWELHSTAALFPRWVAFAAIVFLVCAVPMRRSDASIQRSEDVDENFPQATAGVVNWSTVLALQLGYVIAIYLIGFTIATVVYLLVGPIQMGYRRWMIIALQAVVLTAVISGSFIGFFHIRLPKGILWSLLNHVA